MQKEKRNNGILKTVLDKASYSVGYICAKTAKIKDITKAKAWKDTVSASKDIIEKAGEKTTELIHDAQEGASHIKDSFVHGFESAKEGIAGQGHVKKSSADSQKSKDKAAVLHDAKPKTSAKPKSKKKKKLSPKEKEKKLKEISEAPVDKDMEKEINKIDEGVAEVSE